MRLPHDDWLLAILYVEPFILFGRKEIIEGAHIDYTDDFELARNF